MIQVLIGPASAASVVDCFKVVLGLQAGDARLGDALHTSTRKADAGLGDALHTSTRKADAGLHQQWLGG